MKFINHVSLILNESAVWLFINKKFEINEDILWIKK